MVKWEYPSGLELIQRVRAVTRRCQEGYYLLQQYLCLAGTRSVSEAVTQALCEAVRNLRTISPATEGDFTFPAPGIVTAVAGVRRRSVDSAPCRRASLRHAVPTLVI